MFWLSGNNVCLEEKVSCEIKESPSVMWKRSIVQATAGRARLALLLALALFACTWECGWGADLVIEIPGSGAGESDVDAGGQYRLDYVPPDGTPAPNHTVRAGATTINFRGLPGTKYHFMLYYSNATFADLLTWNQTIITAPEPPTNLTVTLGRNKQATISWSPPAHGNYTGFRFKVIPLMGSPDGEARNITLEGEGNWTHTLRDLSPGATYQLHAFTLLHDKESAAYASCNFTTKPNTPGKFIVWFRNETTLLVLWQPPYPPGAYTHYKVSIEPRDARESELYVEKEGEPPGPAQAAFKGLTPGRAYNISVHTVSEQQISAPTTAQYRTVPLRPRNVTVDPADVTETSFRVTWVPPPDNSEFEKYQVSVSGPGGGGGGGGGGRRLAPALRGRDDPPACSFDGLEPGAHYTVTVKTMSGKVTSWPATADFTLKPLPVRDVGWRGVEGEGRGAGVALWWTPAEGSAQNEYKVAYEALAPRVDSGALTTPATNATLRALLPGATYTLSVRALSRGVASAATTLAAATPPLAPGLETVLAGDAALSLVWRSDVTSLQDRYELRYHTRDPHAHHAPRQLTTRDTNATLTGLYPGAVYEIKLAAISHELHSEWLTVYKPVRPLAPTSLEVRRVSSNAVALRWGAVPAGSALGGYVVRLRPPTAHHNTTLYPPDVTEAEIGGLVHGERYSVWVDAVSEEAARGDSVESGHPRTAQHTVRPNPVSNVAALVDTRNMTLEWPRPEGRVERYSLRWWAAEEAGPGGGPAGGSPGHSRDLLAGPEPTVRAVLDALEPGAGYSVQIQASSYNLTSEPFEMHTRTRPLIQSEMTIVIQPGDGEDDNADAFLQVQYTRTPETASRFDSYRFRLEGEAEGGASGTSGAGGEVSEVTRGAGEAGQQVFFRGLVPGRLYNITMWTVSRNVTSHPVQRPARLYPRAISRLWATQRLSRSIALAWERPVGVATDYQLTYLLAPDHLVTDSTTHTHYNVTGLQPYTNYTFTIEVRAGTASSVQMLSRGVSASFETQEAPPDAPEDFTSVDTQPSRVQLAWRLEAARAHGRVRAVRVECAPEPPRADEPAHSLRLGGAARLATLEGLRPGAGYACAVWAETGAGGGRAARLALRTGIAAPPRPPAHAVPRPLRASPTTLTVQFRRDYFSAANGAVTAYALVAAEEPGDDAPADLPSWRDVHRLPFWPPYQVMEPYYPFGGGPVAEFTIGAERCEGGAAAAAGGGGAAAGRYCNGPLKPGTRYYVKLRAYTDKDKFTDTAYTPLHTEVDNTAWIIGACAAGGALGVAVAGALLLRRRRQRAAAAPPPHAPRKQRPVRVSDFIDHYRLMSADSDFRFSEEFEELKQVGREQPCTAADLPCNRPKNRFTNILPYDHSRYKLQPVDDEEGSDYINANYVPGHNSPREFIVTQGPLHCTRDDFWRMCWESGSRAIVMLTRCVEKGREKCDRYWPYDTRPVYYGDIAVTALNESRYPDWTVTELGVCRGAEQRVVKHFHFTTWPDFGVPDPPTTLARFVRAFRERCPPDSRPVIVHCSAGVGRSGTFITLDRALQQLAAHAEYIDIFGMVYAMRRERVWMVQTEQQYICIHQCLVAVLEGQDLAAPTHNNHHHNPAFEDDEGIAESGM